MLEQLNKGFFGFWVQKFRVSFLLIALVILTGIFSLISIPKESSPDIKFGIISISTVYPGVNPVDMDSLITEKIEQEIKDIEGIKKITSTSGVGVSSTSVELNNGVDINSVMTDIKDKIDTINLPEDAEDPSVTEISTNNSLMFQLVLYGKGLNNFELLQKAKKMESDLEGKSGVASIDVGGVNSGRADASSSGFGDYEIKVNISKSKLESLGLSLGQLAGTIREYNKNTPIGNYSIGDLSYDFRIDGELNSINELQNIIIRDSGSSQVRLSDIAQITKEYENDNYKQLGLYDDIGYNYITLDFNKATGANIFSGAASAKKVIEQYIEGNVYFSGIKTMYIKDMSETIKDDYRSLAKTGLQTLVLVFITILIFVGLTESIIASLVLPLSFLVTFTVLNTLGFSLNFLTNFSLVLTLGIAIDTIIVIIEGGSERYKLGYNRSTSILLAVRDLKGPLISGTMTTLVAFLPMMFLPGIMGKFLSYIPITVFATLLGALILSLTVSSALFLKVTRKSKYFQREKSLEKSMGSDERELLTLQRKDKEETTSETMTLRDKMLGVIGRFYYGKLNFFIRRRSLRLASIMIPFVLLIFTFVVLAPKIGFTLFPASDNNTLTLQFGGATGIRSESLEKYVPQIDEAVSKYEEVKLFYTSISGNTITTYIELTNNLDRQAQGQRSVFEIEELLVGDLEYLQSEGLSFEVVVEAGGPPGGKAVGIGITTNSANNISQLKTVADDFEKFLQASEGTKNVSISSSQTPGQFIFSFDTDKLSNVGLSPNDILTELRSYTAGIKAGSIKSEFEDNNIVLKIQEFDTDLTPEDIANLIIQTQVGKIRVGDYLSSKFDKSLSKINREDTKIVIKVEADITPGTLPTDVQPKLLEYAKNYTYPEGVSYIVGGENEENAELIQSTLQSFVIALFLIFTILVLQFNSYSRPAIILYSVILALTGVNFGLYITGNPYSMPFAIGFIALTGIVVNDAIILLDRIVKNISRVERHIESPTKEDYIAATVGGAKTRLQPIIVTTLTTLFGVLPLALQDAFWAGLGFTIIFGLFAGSFLTLFVIPSLYFEIYLRKKK